MIKLRAEEQGPVSQQTHSLCGVILDGSKACLIEGRLGRMAEEAGCTSFARFVSRAKTDPGRTLERRIIDAITTNETLSIRDTAPFDLLRHKIIPDLIDRRSSASRLRIWSAACSTGQELYSIGIVLKELLGDPDRYGVRLLGTDISDDAVSKASEGIFGGIDVSRGLPDDVRTRHFVPLGDGWKIQDEIRAVASFQRLNLMQDFSSLGKFDIIFCRNVAIYFNGRPPWAVWAHRTGARAERLPGGRRHGVALNGVAPQFEPRRYLRSVFYQVKSGSAHLP